MCEVSSLYVKRKWSYCVETNFPRSHTDGQTEGQTDGWIDSYGEPPPPKMEYQTFT